MKTIGMILLALWCIGDIRAHAATLGLYAQTFFFDQQDFEKLPRSPDGTIAYAGDIIIYLDRVRPRAAISGRLWPRGEFVFRFNGQTATEQAAFRNACNAWTVGTALRCVERTNQTDFADVITHSGKGCGGFTNVSCSAVGMVGGAQRLEVYVTHWGNPGVLQHEIGHALGLIHEQSRPDRDHYVIINTGNIRGGAGHNFAIDESAGALTDYDYTSTMHYSNCAFAINLAACNPNDRATEPHWTISPAPCDLVAVGGNQITPLDLEGIRRAYGGPVSALFESQRKSECGSHKYSRDQVTRVCGSACAMAGPVTWSRLYTRYDWGCGGFITVLDGPKFCAARKQEFSNQWWDQDWPHSKCWGGTLTERWTQCGCTSQTLTAMCTNFQSAINLAKLQDLIDSEDSPTRQVGLFVRRLLDYSDAGYLSPAVKSEMPKIILASYIRRDALRAASFSCELMVEITLRRLTNSSYQMSAGRFLRLARKHDLI